MAKFTKLFFHSDGLTQTWIESKLKQVFGLLMVSHDTNFQGVASAQWETLHYI